MKSDLLLLHHGPDPSAEALRQSLESLGLSVGVLDVGTVPGQGTLALEESRILLRGEVLQAPRLAVNRSRLNRFGVPNPVALGQRDFQTWYGRYLAEKEREAFLSSVLMALETDGVRMINALELSDLAFLRPLILHRLRRAGIETAGPDAATPAEPTLRRTRQPDDSFLRLYLFEDRVLAAGSLALVEGQPFRYEAVRSLPGSAEQVARAVVRQVGTTFAAVDLLMRGAQALYWGWDPAPGFDEFEAETGLEIAGPLAAEIRRLLEG